MLQFLHGVNTPHYITLHTPVLLLFSICMRICEKGNNILLEQVSIEILTEGKSVLFIVQGLFRTYPLVSC
jgi:hypothetical protein